MPDQGPELVTLTGREASVTVNLRRGAKLTSLRGPGDVEWLHRHPGLTPSPDDASSPASSSGSGARVPFTEAEMCGWDECAPTIDPVTLPDGRDYGDHGDVWDRVWTLLHHDERELTCEVVVPDLGFGLRRRMALTDRGFVLDYTAWATDDREVPWLWAAHPQFDMPDDLRLRWLADSPVSVRKAWPAPGDSEPWLTSVSWPVVDEGDAAKFWLEEPLPRGVVLSRDGYELAFTWRDDSAAPAADGEPRRRRLGGVAVWVDPALFASGMVLAVEPATSSADQPSLDPGDARVVLRPGEPLTWSLELAFDATS